MKKFNRYNRIVTDLMIAQERAEKEGDFERAKRHEIKISFYLKKSVEATNGNGNVLDYALLDPELFKSLSPDQIALLNRDYRKILDKGNADGPSDYELSLLTDRLSSTRVTIPHKKGGFDRFKPK